ncbi:helix-turn-helix domain-containing protein [Bacteroides sp.]
MGKDVATVSRWCTNNAQPSVETFTRIAELLDIDIRKLFNKTK